VQISGGRGHRPPTSVGIRRARQCAFHPPTVINSTVVVKCSSQEGHLAAGAITPHPYGTLYNQQQLNTTLTAVYCRLSFYNQQSNNAVNAAGQTIHKVCSGFCNCYSQLQRNGSAAAALGCLITICQLSLVTLLQHRCAVRCIRL